MGHVGEAPLPHYENHFIGNDPSKWGTGARVFRHTMLQGVYPGIDLRVGGDGNLKYDWMVGAGADPGLIALRFEGQDELRIVDGRLRITTTAGDVIEEAPVAWQEIDGKRMPVACRYVLDGSMLRYQLPNGHDPGHPLVIDPVVVFSTYSGSTSDNWGFTATYDDNGNLYAGGIALGAGYPVTPGAIQGTFQGGTHDISLSKFSANGSMLLWSTYLGGSGNECPHSLVVDQAEELFVLGTSGSSNFPTTVGAFQPTFLLGNFENIGGWYGFQYDSGAEIILARLNSTGTALIGSTFVGGSGTDGLNIATQTAYNYGDHFRGEVVLDQQGRPVVATTTASGNMPITAGAAYPVFNGGTTDGYLFCMSQDLTTMAWSTYYGGSGPDAGYGLLVAENGEVYLTGGSASQDLPMAGNPFDATANGGVDGYIARFNADGTALLSSTHLGTSAYDQCYFVQQDTANAVYVVGQTRGSYPVTPGKYANPTATQFIHKLSTDLSESIWSTRIGGTGTEDISPTAFLVSDCKQIYFSGWAGSTNNIGQPTNSSTFNLPVTVDAFQPSTTGSDFYLMVLNAEANSLSYATFFGGSSAAEHVDGGTSRFDKNGTVYQAVCAGCGGTSDMPTTPGVWSQSNNSLNCNIGLFKIDFEQAVVAAVTGNYTACDPAEFQFVNGGSGQTWLWDFGDGSPTSTEQAPTHAYPGPGEYLLTLIAYDPTSCNLSDTTTTLVVVQPSIPPDVAFTIEQNDPCAPFTIQLVNGTTGEGLTWAWNISDGTFFGTQNASHTFGGPGEYTVTLTATEPTCQASASLELPVALEPPPPVVPEFTILQGGICGSLNVSTQNGSSGGVGQLSFSWNMGDDSVYTSTNAIHTYGGAGTYTITLVATDECGNSASAQFDVQVEDEDVLEQLLNVPNVFSPNGDGSNDTFFPIPETGGRVSLTIFNRWGKVIYETGSNYRPWNGNVRPGDKAPDGVYFYLLEYDIPCGTSDYKGRKEGHVQMLR